DAGEDHPGAGQGRRCGEARPAFSDARSDEDGAHARCSRRRNRRKRQCRAGRSGAGGNRRRAVRESRRVTLHIIKLCVGVDSLEDLAAWQKQRLAERKKKKQPLVLQHVTRMTPKRADEVLDGGSLYWVIRGLIATRQEQID